MTLEYIDDTTSGGQFKGVVSDKLIRLYDFDSREAGEFQAIIKNLTQNQQSVSVNSLSFIKKANC